MRLSTVGKIPVNYLGVPFAEHCEQPMSVAHCLYGVSLIRRLDGIFEPGGDAWICKDFFKSHNQVYSWLLRPGFDISCNRLHAKMAADG
jgi:hypothetical protein